MTITIRLSELSEACEDERDLFESLFGDTLTIKTKREAIALAKRYAQGFHWGWAARNLLSDEAWAEWSTVPAAAWAESRKASIAFRAAAWVYAIARPASGAVAWTPAGDATRAKYKNACAIAFATALWEDRR